jgi:hypothetical protein
MKKIILFTMVSLTLLQACSYKPIIDTAGRSGTFNEDKAKEITNDIQHCKYLAKENTNFISNITYWTLSPTMDTKYESIMRKCLDKRGHSVLN